MKNLLIVVVILVVLFPFIPKLIPKALSIERVTKAFEDEGYTLDDLQEVAPFREAAQQWNFFVQDYRVELYRYGEAAKAAVDIQYLQRDEGTRVVETAMENAGVRPANMPSVALKRGKWIFYVQGPDRAICRQLAGIFNQS